jgi:hypothetical protein
VSPADLGQLLALLKGMCTRRHELEENEYGMVGFLLVRASCNSCCVCVADLCIVCKQEYLLCAALPALCGLKLQLYVYCRKQLLCVGQGHVCTAATKWSE